MLSAKSFHETFYGTPTEDETRRRRGKKRHNKAAKEEPQNEVAVIGVHYLSFDDDSLAAFVNSATALVPWNGDPKLLIDRYDVRHLLQDLTGIRRRRAPPPSPDATKEELDYERYRDVEGLENPSPPEDELKNEDVTGGGYQRVGFDYGTSGDLETRKERVEDVLFSPPFFVPEHLRLQIPTSTKVHQIMAGTAKYVIEHGGQAEIVLRVKQANNPTFGFLMPDHQDHEYFRFLVAHPEHVGIGPSSQQATVPEVAAPTSSEEAEGGLSLLGTAYGDADEDEEEGEGSEAYKDQAEEPLIVAKEDLEEVDTVTTPHVEGSDHGATSKRSSTINLITSDVAENATKDTGDSLEVSLRSEVLKIALQSGEVPADGLVDSSPGSRGPVPPGMEACSSGSGEMEVHESRGHSGDLYHQVVPPYKKPPLRLRLIINKMVEYIARNGKEFEAIVKDRDKTDHRFPFFLPWNEYHPYYAKELESARQARLSAEAEATGIPSTSDPLNPLQGQEAAEKNEGTESFLNGVPFWDMAQAVESNGLNGEGEMSNMPECEEDQSHNGEGGMGFEAVLAAVRFATRGRPQPVEGNHESDLLKVSDGDERPGIGSDEAVLAAIRAATGRTKLDSSGSVGKKDIPNAPDVKDARDLTQTSTLSRKISVGDSSDPIGTATPLAQSSVDAIVGLDEDHVVVPHLVTKAAAVSLVEGDSAEPQLTTPEKRKAERLKKAKLFAAMIKDKKGSLTNPVQLSGSPGISAPKLDRLNQVFVALESTTVDLPAASIDAKPETRDRTADTQVRVATEGDKELVDSSVKQRKHKAKSKDDEERKRKHRHKRKKDMDERENGREHSPGTRERREDKYHDHYQDGKRKEGKYDPESEGRAKDSKRGLSEGKSKIDGGFQYLEDRREEHEEPRKDRSHYTNDSDRRKESRYGYEAEQKKRRDRHGQDSEGTRKRSRHERDSEDERREDRQKHDKSRHGYDSEVERRVDRQKHNKTRHGYDSEEERKGDRQKHDISRHQYDSEEERRGDRQKHDISRHQYDFEEERRGDRQKEDTDRKRRSRHDSEEKRGRDRYDYDSDDIRKERSERHGKRKKHSDRADADDDKDGRRNDSRTKKSSQHNDDFDSSTHVDRQSTHHRDVKDEGRIRVVSLVKQDVPPQTNVSQMRVGEEKPTLSSADVPDDIRAKVRAMLAMM